MSPEVPVACHVCRTLRASGSVCLVGLDMVAVTQDHEVSGVSGTRPIHTLTIQVVHPQSDSGSAAEVLTLEASPPQCHYPCTLPPSLTVTPHVAFTNRSNTYTNTRNTTRYANRYRGSCLMPRVATVAVAPVVGSLVRTTEPLSLPLSLSVFQ